MFSLHPNHPTIPNLPLSQNKFHHKAQNQEMHLQASTFQETCMTSWQWRSIKVETCSDLRCKFLPKTVEVMIRPSMNQTGFVFWCLVPLGSFLYLDWLLALHCITISTLEGDISIYENLN